jgi:hypothetical protein
MEGHIDLLVNEDFKNYSMFGEHLFNIEIINAVNKIQDIKDKFNALDWDLISIEVYGNLQKLISFCTKLDFYTNIYLTE